MPRAALLVFAGPLLAGAALHAETGTCLALERVIRAGEFLTAEAAGETPCRDRQPTLPLSYDRDARAPVATAAIPAGTYLGHLVLAPGPIAAPGDKLALVIRSGPVTITREVSPLRPARAGERVFVRTADGDVLAARFAAAEAGQ